MTLEERCELMSAVQPVWELVRANACDFNLGLNDGAAAGQTVPHAHLHLIPRRPGDVPDPVGGVRGVIPAHRDWRRIRQFSSPARPALLSGPPHLALEDDLLAALATAVRCDIATAFVTESGIGVLATDIAATLRKSGGRVRIVTGDYLGFNEPRALRRLLDFGNSLELYVHQADGGAPFHAKSYLVENEAGHRIAFVGSSNLTLRALRENLEWNVRLDDHLDPVATTQAFEAFEKLILNPSVARADHQWIDRYEARRPTPAVREIVELPVPQAECGAVDWTPVKPHAVQLEALEALKASLENGDTRGLVVLATGLGKTILAALYHQAGGFKRCLFVAHREEILDQATSAFRRVFPDAKTSRIGGGGFDSSGDFVFASIQTLGRVSNLQRIDPQAFDLVVMDEFHHADAPTYRRVIDRLTPRYMLGLTATPDRTDRGDILALCNDRLVFERGIHEGIHEKLLAPFSYFGITDSVDYSQIPWRNGRFDPTELDAKLASEERARQALSEWKRRVKSGSRTLAFCASARHADFMRRFTRDNMREIRCAAVHSGPESDPRRASLEALRRGELNILYCVDMFNEGVDVPEVDAVLMLRPTASSIIFQQQFGRGLRFLPDKKLIAVDFVGNHRSFILQLMSFLGDQTRDAVAQTLQRAQAANGLISLPNDCSMQYDLGAINLLAQVVAARRVRQCVEDWLDDYYRIHGRRPTFRTAMECGFFMPGGAAQPGQEAASWANLLRGGANADPLAQTLGKPAMSMLDLVQRTPMTRCFKMLILEAFAEHALPPSIQVAQLTEHFRQRAAYDSRVKLDIGVDTNDRSALQQYILRNPIQAWTTPNAAVPTPLFARQGDQLLLQCELSDAERAAGAKIMLDIVEGRLWSYFNRPRAA